MFNYKASRSLVHAVLSSAIKDRDEGFVDSPLCKFWCELGGVDYKEFKAKFEERLEQCKRPHVHARGKLLYKLPEIEELRAIAKECTLGQMSRMFNCSPQSLSYFLRKNKIEYIKKHQQYKTYMYRGVRYNLTTLCLKYKIHPTTFLARLDKGFSVREAIEEPIIIKFRRKGK